VSQLNLQRPELLEQRCLVGGGWIDGPQKFEVRNPATNAVIASVPRFGRKEVEHAIAAAADAMPDWAGQTAKQRAAILRRWYDLMLDPHSTTFARHAGVDFGRV
jgi:succinate-semialdehyde dehydrogenase / glutarate-semialdehyde dehydrogenase